MQSTFITLEPLLRRVATVPGDIAEIGVYRGKIFLQMLPFARRQGKLCHAVDSFCGMAEPTRRDFHDARPTEYLKGALDAGGSESLRERTTAHADVVRIWEGFVPEVLARLPTAVAFSFVAVDLDHYAPTLAALEWAWDRMSPRGVLVSHDWFPERDVLASAAIKDFMHERRLEPSGSENRYVWFVKPVPEAGKTGGAR